MSCTQRGEVIPIQGSNTGMSINRSAIVHAIPSLVGGGAERQICYLARAQVDLGYDVHVVFLHRGPNMTRLRASGAHVHQLFAATNYDPILVLQFAAILNKVKPIAVQTWLRQMDILGGMAAMSSKTPWILTERSSAAAYPKSIKHDFRAYLAHHASAIIGNSAAGIEYWRIDQECAEIPCEFIRNIVPTEEILSVPALKSLSGQLLDNDDELILFAGRFTDTRSIDTLTDACLDVLKQRPKCHVLLIGDGPERAAAVRKVHEHGLLERFGLPGHMTAEQVWSAMRRATVFVFLSAFEGQPNSVLEATVSGCALVLSNIREHYDLVGPRGAFFVERNDTRAVTASILNCLDDRESAKLRTRNAVSFASPFTEREAALAYRAMYEHVGKREH